MLLQTLVCHYAVGNCDAGTANCLESLNINTSVQCQFCVLRMLHLRPLALQMINGRLKVWNRSQLLVQLLKVRVANTVNFCVVHDTTVSQRFGICLRHTHATTDILVHERLRKCRFIQLIVTPATVSDHVQDDVFAEHHAVLECQLGSVRDALRIITVHVYDRRINHLAHVTCIYRTARVLRRCSVSNLIVDHDVH